jgi:hypothetical protein
LLFSLKPPLPLHKEQTEYHYNQEDKINRNTQPHIEPPLGSLRGDLFGFLLFQVKNADFQLADFVFYFDYPFSVVAQ